MQIPVEGSGNTSRGFKKSNDEDVDDIGGGGCHKMLQMTLPIGVI